MYSDLSTKGNSAEDALKINVVQPLSKEKYEASLLVEAAKRVVFKNCLEACEVDMARFSKFNRDFYYNMLDEQKCLQGCYNTRMAAHFGEETAKTTDGLQMDFGKLKREYHEYEKFHPDFRKTATYWSGAHESQLDSIIQNVKAKSQKAQDKFSFQ